MEKLPNPMERGSRSCWAGTLRINVFSAVFSVRPYCFLVRVTAVRVPCGESQAMTAESLKKLFCSGWGEGFACVCGPLGLESWRLLFFSYCPTMSSFNWSHSLGVGRVLPAGRHSGVEELEPLFVFFKTKNTWMHPFICTVDINCDPLWFEFKPKS